jgi:hypothetical protein
MIKRFFILFFSCSSFVAVYAQPAPSGVQDSVLFPGDLPDESDAGVGAIAVLSADTMLVARPVFIEPDTIKAWKNKKEFAYLKNLDSLLKASQDKANKPADTRKRHESRRSPVNDFLAAPFFRTLLIVLALFFVAVILYHLLKNQAIFKRPSVAMQAREEEVGEDELLENDYQKLIHQAYKLSDYRMAVRYLFLYTLQQLKDKNLVEFARDKTNSRYAREIPEPLRNDFSKLVLAYEYAWYGNFSVSREQFELIQKQFSSFFNKI